MLDSECIIAFILIHICFFIFLSSFLEFGILYKKYKIIYIYNFLACNKSVSEILSFNLKRKITVLFPINHLSSCSSSITVPADLVNGVRQSCRSFHARFSAYTHTLTFASFSARTYTCIHEQLIRTRVYVAASLSHSTPDPNSLSCAWRSTNTHANTRVSVICVPVRTCDGLRSNWPHSRALLGCCCCCCWLRESLGYITAEAEVHVLLLRSLARLAGCSRELLTFPGLSSPRSSEADAGTFSQFRMFTSNNRFAFAMLIEQL